VRFAALHCAIFMGSAIEHTDYVLRPRNRTKCFT